MGTPPHVRVEALEGLTRLLLHLTRGADEEAVARYRAELGALRDAARPEDRNLAGIEDQLARLADRQGAPPPLR